MLPPRWISAPPYLPAARPLRQPGSLTARLARSGEVSVDLLTSGWHPASHDEATALGLPRAGLRVFARQVCVRRNGKPAVLARSVTTMAGIAGPWQGLRRLGRQPLAALLWSKPDIRRGAFEYARLSTNDSLLLATGIGGALPARRSCFRRHGQPLLVLEAFVGLPWPGATWRSRRRRWTA